MKIKQGEIFLVNFDPSFGHEYQKIRPALVVANDKFIPLGNLITIIPISSKLDKITPLDVFIVKDNINRMHADSLIKIKQISSFDKRRLIKKIGSCNQHILSDINNKIEAYLKFEI